jgi:hypothetical protein
MEYVRISARLGFQPLITAAEPPDEPGGLPKRLGRAPRHFPLQARALDDGGTQGVVVLADPPEQSESNSDQTSNPFESLDVALLAFRLEANAFDTALTKAQPLMEAIIDHFAFQVQSSVPILSLDLLDVTPPLRLGDERDFQAWGQAPALLAPKFMPMDPDFRWNEQVLTQPTLEGLPGTTDEKLRMVLWWYVKALDTPYVVDRFLFLWTAAEILWERSDFRVTGPYTADCGHTIVDCPTCSAPVDRLIRGASIREYLSSVGGLSDKKIKQLWEIRQAVHGRNVFREDRISVVSDLCGWLRSVVFNILRSELHWPDDMGPYLIEQDGPSLRAGMAVGGRHKLSEVDLELDALQIRTLSGLDS